VRQADGTVALTWSAALDCDGHAVAGYNLYRRSAADESYTKLNTTLLTALAHTDAGLTTAPAGALYYYALTAVDAASDESVKSAPASVGIPAAGQSAGGGAGGGGGCFISAAGLDLSSELLMPLAAMALLICLIWISRRRRQ
jgi:hypothetical protein